MCHMNIKWNFTMLTKLKGCINITKCCVISFHKCMRMMEFFFLSFLFKFSIYILWHNVMSDIYCVHLSRGVAVCFGIDLAMQANKIVSLSSIVLACSFIWLVLHLHFMYSHLFLFTFLFYSTWWSSVFAQKIMRW